MRAHPLEEKRLVTDGKSLELAPGMAVVVEIKTGKRRDLDYCSRHSIRGFASSDLPLKAYPPSCGRPSKPCLTRSPSSM